jgi:acyl-CoA synthetase (NDP forming)
MSYGNACDLNETDFMEYVADDPETKIITCYIEGTKDGRRFIRALSRATKAKPIIMLKGGVTEAGRGAVASHTGALAGSARIWEALYRQLGILQAHDLDELIDLVLLFQFLNPIHGRRIGAVGVGGGFSVLTSDTCEGEGLIVPSFPSELRKELRTIIPEELDPGTTVRNPVDLASSGWNTDMFSKALTTIAKFEGVDFLCVFTAVAFGLYRGTNMMVEGQVNTVIEAKKILINL